MEPLEVWHEEVQTQLTKIEGHLLRQNGDLDRLHEEIFGDSSRGTSGMKADLTDVREFMTEIRTVLRTLRGIAYFLGATNVFALIFVLTRVL